MILELNPLNHPIFVHSGVLIPNLHLRYRPSESTSAGIDTHIVGVQANRVRERIGTTNCDLRAPFDAREGHNRRFHVVLLHPRLERVVFEHTTLNFIEPFLEMFFLLIGGASPAPLSSL